MRRYSRQNYSKLLLRGAVLLILLLIIPFAVYAQNNNKRAEQQFELYEKILDTKSETRRMEILKENLNMVDKEFLIMLDESAKDFLKKYKPAEAATNWGIIALCAKLKEDQKLEAQSFLKVGNALEMMKMNRKAFDAYLKAKELSSSGDDGAVLTDASIGMSSTSNKLFQSDEARAYLDEAQLLAERFDLKKEKIECMRISAEIFAYTAQGEKAKENFDEALKMAQKAKDIDSQIHIIESRSIFLAKSREFDEVEISLENLSDILKSKGDTQGYAKCQRIRGGLAIRKKEDEKAIKFLEEARDNFKKSENYLEEAEADLILAPVYGRDGRDGNLEKGQAIGQEARYLFNKMGAVSGYLDSLLVLSELFLKVGKLDIAENYAKEAIEGYKTMDNLPGMALSCIMMGKICQKGNKTEDAKKYFQIVRAFSEKAGKLKLIGIKVLANRLGIEIPDKSEIRR